MKLNSIQTRGEYENKQYIQSMLQVYSFPDRPYDKLKSRSVHTAVR